LHDEGGIKLFPSEGNDLTSREPAVRKISRSGPYHEALSREVLVRLLDVAIGNLLDVLRLFEKFLEKSGRLRWIQHPESETIRPAVDDTSYIR